MDDDGPNLPDFEIPSETGSKAQDTKENLVEEVGHEEDVVELVDDVISGWWHGKVAPEYRVDVAEEFIALRGSPAKRKKGQVYRTAAQARLDRAFTRVADRVDKSEGTIRTSSVHTLYECTHDQYCGGETQHFLEDLLEISRRYYEGTSRGG